MTTIHHSIHPDELVIFKDGNGIKLGSIESVYETKSGKTIKNDLSTGFSFETKQFDEQLCVPSFSDNGQISFKEISGMIRHHLDGQLYKLTLEGKRTILTTGSHSVFTKSDDGIIEPTLVECLNNGD